MVKYQIIGNTNICTTIDADTICQEAEMLIRDEFTVIVQTVVKR